MNKTIISMGAAGLFLLIQGGLPLHATDLNVDGNLTVTGTGSIVDFEGGTLNLGTLSGTGGQPGMGLIYTDGTAAIIDFIANRNAANWRWWTVNGSQNVLSMKLDGTNQLILYSGTAAAITLSPAGTSAFAGNMIFSGTDNQMPNQVLIGNNSILTEGLADGRYLSLSAAAGYLTQNSADSRYLSQTGTLSASQISGTLPATVSGVSIGGVLHGSGTEAPAFTTLVTSGSTSINGGGLVASGSTIRLSGNVGVGTNSPAAELHITGTGEQLRLAYDASNYFSTTVGVSGGVTFDSAGAGAGFTFQDGVNVNGLIGFATNGVANFQNGAPGGFVLGADANMTTRTNNFRKIGGISVPTYTNGNAVATIFRGDFQGASYGGVFIGGVPGGSAYAASNVFFATAPNDTTNGAGIVQRMSVDSTGQVAINGFNASAVGLSITGGTSQTGHLLNVTSSGGTAGNLFSIDSAGNAGIGTATPGYKLDVAGNINLSGTLFKNGQPFSSSAWLNSGTNVILNTGNVGIGTGTTAPGSILTVNGTVTAASLTFSGTGGPIISGTGNAMVTGTIQATALAGDGSQLTNLSAANLTGTLSPSVSGVLHNSGTENATFASLTTSGSATINAPLTVSGTAPTPNRINNGGIIVTGSAVTSGTTTKIVSTGTNQLVLIPEAGDISMGDFVAGAKPQ